jgi:large subunit ribosomal protein L6
MPASRIKVDIARILQDEGYVQGFKLIDEAATQEDCRLEDAASVPEVRTARRAADHGRAANQPARPPRLLRARRCALKCWRAGHEHPHDLARRDDRPRRGQGRRRRRSPLQHLVRTNNVSNRKETHRIPKGVTVKVLDGAVEVQGPKGKLKQRFSERHQFRARGRSAVGEAPTDDPGLGKFHGLARSLVANAVAGVTDGFKKELDIVGVGYRAEVKGKQVIFALGYSHAVVFDIPQGIDVAIDKQTHITVTGVDRQLVGQVAANIRRLREAGSLQAEGRALHG